MYQLFTNKDESYDVVSPSIKAARDYARLIVRCAPRSMQERLELATQYGWNAKEVKDEVFYEDYQKERASILFPHLRKEITQNIDNLNVSEVDRAEGFFTKATGLALKEPSLITERTQQIPDPTAYSVADGGCETNRFQRDKQPEQ